MSTMDLLEKYREKYGWNYRSLLEMLCEYVDNQQDLSAVDDFLKRQAKQEGEL